MSKKEKRNELRKKGVEIKNNAATTLLPSVVNNTILIESTLLVLLATLGEPTHDSICLYRLLLCALLLSIVLGVLCTSIVAIDFYTLGNKVLDVAETKPQKDIRESESEPYIRTGKKPLYATIITFGGCILTFLISVILLVLYAWNPI